MKQKQTQREQAAKGEGSGRVGEGVGEGSGMSKKLEGPRQQAGLGVGLSGLSSGRLEAQMLTPRWKEEGSRCPPRAAGPHSGSSFLVLHGAGLRS